MQKRLVDLTKSDSLNDSDYLFINHDDNPIQVSLPYFKQNVAPVDATLTEEGKAADAKATGDKIDEINTNIETINTEIEGVKTNYATKEELNAVSTSLTETQEDVSALSSSIESVKTNYLTKSDAQSVYLTKEDASAISDKEFYEGRKYNGMTYTGKTSDKGIKLHSVQGKTTQQTTNGYQLFDASKLPTKTQGGATVTNNGDGSFTVSGSGNLTEIFTMSGDFIGDEITLKVGTLKYIENGDVYPRVQVIGSKVKNNVSLENRLFTLSTVNPTVEITEQMLSELQDIYVNIYGGKDQPIKIGTFKPMLYQDGDGTWEPFTGGKPAPNPDYPMPIENVEITKINSRTNQLFDASKLPTKSLGGATVTNNNDGSFTVSGSGNLTRDFSLSYALTKEDIKCLFRSGRIYIKDAIREAIYFEIVIHSSLGNIQLRNGDEYSFEKDFLDEAIDGRILFYGFEGFLIPNETCKPMVYQDGDGTWEDFKHSNTQTSLTLAEGDVYENGVIKKSKYIGELTSSMDWKVNSNSTRIYSSVSGLKTNTNSNIQSNYFIKGSWLKDTHDTICLGNGTLPVVGVSYSQFGSVENFKSWLDEKKSQGKPCIILADLKTPTTEELKVPTVPSYYPYTNVSTDNDLETDITWKILADCDNSLKQEELEKRILALETKAIE